MNEKSKECAIFFQSRPGYRRILTEILKKYQRYGRPAGTVRLDDATPEECDAARGIFGHPFSPPLKLRTDQFEAAIQDSLYRGASLKEVLEFYFDTEIRTRHEVRQAQDSLFSAMLSLASERVQNETCRRWLYGLEDQQGRGYPLLRREAAKNLDGTQLSLLQACRSLDQLERHPQGAIRLAVLSAQATSDPHALDSGTLCGKLFLYLLSFRSNLAFPENAEQRDSLYYENGILCDSISSLVTQVGLVLDVEAGEHPAYRLLRQRHEMSTLSLASLSGLSGAHSSSGRAYIVENEMVFAQLCDQAARFHSPLICTSGQPSVAALRLLDLLAVSDTELFYSGDFDGKGLSIAAQLCARYPTLLRPWHMAPEDYGLCRSDVLLSEASRALLQGCARTALEPSAEAVRKYDRAGYQELLIPLLETDLIGTP